MLKKKKKKGGGGHLKKKKKVSNIGSCPQVPVTRPTLIFSSDPMHFYTEFG